jgi:hypothetical protein
MVSGDLLKAGVAERLFIDTRTGELVKRISDYEFREPIVAFPHECVAYFWIDDEHVADISMVFPPDMLNIDSKHQRVNPPVFDTEEKDANYFYIIAIRNIRTEGITVLSLPVRKGAMVEFSSPLQRAGALAMAVAATWAVVHAA